MWRCASRPPVSRPMKSGGNSVIRHQDFLIAVSLNFSSMITRLFCAKFFKKMNLSLSLRCRFLETLKSCSSQEIVADGITDSASASWRLASHPASNPKPESSSLDFSSQPSVGRAWASCVHTQAASGEASNLSSVMHANDSL